MYSNILRSDRVRVVANGYLPLKRGFAAPTANGPRLPNWPKVHSKKMTGMPSTTKAMRQGRMKAPGPRDKRDIHYVTIQ